MTDATTDYDDARYSVNEIRKSFFLTWHLPFTATERLGPRIFVKLHIFRVTGDSLVNMLKTAEVHLLPWVSRSPAAGQHPDSAQLLLAARGDCAYAGVGGSHSSQ